MRVATSLARIRVEAATLTNDSLVAHNTFVSWSQVLVNSVGFIRNMQLRNNLFITVMGGYLWEDTENPIVPDSWRTDIDYDGVPR